jgi:cytoskeletal protein RodZ
MAYKILIFFLESRCNLKEIGETLKEARENMGLSIEEAANDLKLKPSQIENIEAGNKDAFKDVFYLKYFVRDYSKYLGLDYEDMIDEFNEFLFDYTSKISLDDIKKAKKKVDNKEQKKISSPYTKERKKNSVVGLILTYILILIIIIVSCIMIITKISENQNTNNTPTENVIK